MHTIPLTHRASTATQVATEAAIALFALPALAYLVRAGFEPTTGVTLVREIGIVAAAAALLWYILRVRGESLSSIGWQAASPRLVAVWTLIGLAAGAVALVAGMLLINLFHLRFGSAPGAPVAPASPLWLTLLIVLRAGVVEELLYRGIAIDRVTSLSSSRVIGAVIPLLAFAGFHYGQGAGGVLLALLMGGALTALYLWKRSLLTNMLVHFTIDFIPNVALPLMSGD